MSIYDPGSGADESGITGRAPGEEEDAQGPREEENHIHEALCERDDDGGEEEGQFFALSSKLGRVIFRTLYWGIVSTCRACGVSYD